MKIKISWEITNVFLENIASDSEDEDDEDALEAYEDSKKRLKEADDLTRHMTREEYQHYSDCRQASFTYRKAKRFREFVNFSAFMEGNPNDEVMDVLGFLAYEMVRSLCEGGYEYQRSLESKRAIAEASERASNDQAPSGKRRKRIGDGDSTERKKARVASPSLPEPAGLFSGARTADNEEEDVLSEGRSRPPSPPPPLAIPEQPKSALFEDPKTENVPLIVGDIEGAFMSMQRDKAMMRLSGMRNWRGGLVRTRVGLI